VSFDFRQLETFCRVVEEKSFSRAAASLRLSQAAVSERIAALEEAIGARLLDRRGREALPTQVGSTLFRRARELIARAAEVRREIDALLGVDKGDVALGASTIPGEYILPGMLVDFRRRYPGVSVSLRIGDTESIASAVVSGDLEIGIIGSRTAHRGLRRRPLWSDELALIVPRRHPWAGRGSVSLSDLRNEPFLMRERGSGTRSVMEERLARATKGGVNLRVVAELGSTSAVKTGILGGLGVSILSRRAVEVETRSGLVAALRVSGLAIRRTFILIQPVRAATSPAVARLVDFLFEKAEC
jgi:DNA-binding transcriptional LysR family regulator